MSAIEDARAALGAIDDNNSYGDGGIDSRVLAMVEEALRNLIAEHERLQTITDETVNAARVAFAARDERHADPRDMRAALEAARDAS